MLETIVNYAGARVDQAYICFRNLGMVWYDGHHIFPTRVLNQRELQGLEANLQEAEITYEVKSGIFDKPYLSVVHVAAPLGFAGSLRDIVDPRNTEQSIFYTTHQTDQLRWRVANVGEKYAVPDEIAGAFEVISNLNVQLQEAYEHFKHKRGEARQQAIKEHMDPITEVMDVWMHEANRALSPYDFSVVYDEDKRELQMHATSLDGLVHRGYMTPEDMRNMRIAFMDTENPLFMEEGSKTSWIGIAVYEHQEPKEKAIFTTNPVEFDIAGDYDVYSYESYGAMEEGLSEFMVRHNLDMIVGQNIFWYDLKKMRDDSLDEDGEFNLHFNEHGKGKVKSTVFSREKRYDPELGKERVFYDILFQRIGADTLMVVDLYQIARQGLSFLPNMKLETLTEYLFPDRPYRKSISYEEMAENERAGRYWQTALYLTEDVDEMVAFIMDPQRQFANTGTVTPYALDDYCALAGRWRLHIENLMKDSRETQKYSERKYFENHGTYMPKPYSYNLQKEKKSRWAKFNRRIIASHNEWAQEVPFINGHTLAYFPWPDYVAQFWKQGRLRSQQPEVYDFLVTHKYALDPRTSLEVPPGYTIRGDSIRQFFLTNLLRAFMKPLAVDLAGALYDNDQRAGKRFWGRTGINAQDFMNIIQRKTYASVRRLHDMDVQLVKEDGSRRQIASLEVPEHVSREELLESKVLVLE